MEDEGGDAILTFIGSVSERPKVQHSKCCVVSQPPWVQIPALPPQFPAILTFSGSRGKCYPAALRERSASFTNVQ